MLAGVDFKLELLAISEIAIALTSNRGDFLAIVGYDSFGRASFTTVLGSVSSSCVGTLGANNEGWNDTQPGDQWCLSRIHH